MSRKTAATIEQVNSQQAPKTDGRKRNGRNPNSRKNLVAPWGPGESGNPSGKPGFDVAAYLCRRAIEQNQEAIYAGLSAGLIGCNAYLLQVCSDRAYGKTSQKVIHTGSEAGGPIQSNITVEFVNPKDE